MQNQASPQKALPTSGSEAVKQITPNQTPVKSPVPKKTKVEAAEEGATGGEISAAENSMDTRPTLDLEEEDEIAPEERHEADDRRLLAAGILFSNYDEVVSKCEGELKEFASWAEKVMDLLVMEASERTVRGIQFRLVDPEVISERLESAVGSYREAMALNDQLLQAISAKSSSMNGIQAVVDDKIAMIKGENWSEAWMAKKIAGIEFWGQEAAKRFHQKVADLEDAYKQFVEIVVSKVVGLYDFIKESEECDQGDADADMLSMEAELTRKLDQMTLSESDSADHVAPSPHTVVQEVSKEQHQDKIQEQPAAIQKPPEPLPRSETPVDAPVEPEPTHVAVAEDLKRKNTVEIEARPVISGAEHVYIIYNYAMPGRCSC